MKTYKPYRRDDDHTYCLGVYPTIESLLHRPEAVQQVLLHSKGKQNQGVAKIHEMCFQSGIEILEKDSLVEKLSRRGNTYAIGVVEKKTPRVAHKADHLVLVHPGSMGNLGTIMRTMVGFGMYDLVIIEPAADPFDPKVIRASMGAFFQLNLSMYDQFPDYWGSYAKHQLYPLMTNGKQLLSEAVFQSPFALIFGEESSGLGEEYLQVGSSIRIPHANTIDSLNIAVSVGITLYQIKHGPLPGNV